MRIAIAASLAVSIMGASSAAASDAALRLGQLNQAAQAVQLMGLINQGGRPQGDVVRYNAQAIRAVDGDTIALGSERVRLFGIDAPEVNQMCKQDQRDVPCGQMARTHLQTLLLGGREVTCTTVDRDRYGRAVGRCTREDGVELNRAMVRQGWALSYAPRGTGPYAAEEVAARSRQAGIHGMAYERPSEYRAARR